MLLSGVVSVTDPGLVILLLVALVLTAVFAVAMTIKSRRDAHRARMAKLAAVRAEIEAELLRLGFDPAVPGELFEPAPEPISDWGEARTDEEWRYYIQNGHFPGEEEDNGDEGNC